MCFSSPSSRDYHELGSMLTIDDVTVFIERVLPEVELGVIFTSFSHKSCDDKDCNFNCTRTMPITNTTLKSHDNVGCKMNGLKSLVTVFELWVDVSSHRTHISF